MVAPGSISLATAGRGASHLCSTDRFFVGLRLAAIMGGTAWLCLIPHPEHQHQLVVLFLVFFIYTLLIYGIILLSSWPIRRLYLAAVPADLLFLLGLVRWTGGVMSAFDVGFYLLVGLHTFYFGWKVGLLIATGAAALLVLSELNMFGAEPWPDSAMRVAFVYVIGFAIGVLSEEEKQARRKVEGLLAELQTAARALEHAQKVALIGRLTAGLAHEINNPAAVILIRLERMLLEAEERSYPAALKKDLESLQKHGHRIAGVVQKLLRYSRPDATGFVPLDINEVIRQSIPLIEHRLEAQSLTLNLNLLHHLPGIYGDASRLEEVFVNLLSNAIDASPPGGQIYVVSTISGEPEGRVRVCVTDAGEGIPPENLDKIFEPFFTTKPPGQGTGLGLYVTYQILKDHSATISVESQPGKETTVAVEFPLLRDAPVPAPAG